jgi:type IV secretory pathway VirB3-like protein
LLWATKLSPSQARPKIATTATRPARIVGVCVTASGFTPVTASITAAADSIAISIATGIGTASTAPRG